MAVFSSTSIFSISWRLAQVQTPTTRSRPGAATSPQFWSLRNCSDAASHFFTVTSNPKTKQQVHHKTKSEERLFVFTQVIKITKKPSKKHVCVWRVACQTFETPWCPVPLNVVVTLAWHRVVFGWWRLTTWRSMLNSYQTLIWQLHDKDRRRVIRSQLSV